ncbi:MAG: hypothetical protein P1P84_05625, partial [Deferrisomatales bacterium]|nr:hypothetical protein [Deferrisomatales bacterium]
WAQMITPNLCPRKPAAPYSEQDLRKGKRAEKMVEFRDYVESLTKKYFSDLGPNGYAALNVLTDFATRPVLYISQANMVNTLQTRSADWISAFLAEIEKKDFAFDSYLAEHKQSAELLRGLAA